MKKKRSPQIYLNNEQLKTLSGIAKDIGQIFFASSFVPFLLGVDNINIAVVIWTLIVSMGCWILSLFLLKGVKNDT